MYLALQKSDLHFEKTVAIFVPFSNSSNLQCDITYKSNFFITMVNGCKRMAPLTKQTPKIRVQKIIWFFIVCLVENDEGDVK